MTASIDEDTVDFRPNYDGRETEPSVLPAALPNLLVNGAAGIAVGMATNIAPHNLIEVVQALRHLIDHPAADLDDLMRFVPGPDLPTGGKIVGLEGIRDAYATGNGSFRMRATARIENVTPRRRGIVVTELPYNVGPEKVIEAIKKLVQAKKLQGISDIKNLTDRHKGLNLVIEVKSSFNPEAILDQLYRHTPMETSFGINAVALVDGQPRTLGLKEMLTVFLDHRYDVVRRRTAFRRRKAADRLHLVDGLLIAILDIDEVIQLIRASDDRGQARERLISVFDLERAAGRLHPRPPARPAHQVLPHRAREGVRAAARDHRRARRDPRRRRVAALGRRRRARRDGPAVRHAAAHRAARGRRPDRHRRRAARGRRRPVLGAALRDRPARPHDRRRPVRRDRPPGQARHDRRGRAHRPPAARSASSRPAARFTGSASSRSRRSRRRRPRRTCRAASRCASSCTSTTARSRS